MCGCPDNVVWTLYQCCIATQISMLVDIGQHCDNVVTMLWQCHSRHWGLTTFRQCCVNVVATLWQRCSQHWGLMLRQLSHNVAWTLSQCQLNMSNFYELPWNWQTGLLKYLTFEFGKFDSDTLSMADLWLMKVKSRGCMPRKHANVVATLPQHWLNIVPMLVPNVVTTLICRHFTTLPQHWVNIVARLHQCRLMLYQRCANFVATLVPNVGGRHWDNVRAILCDGCGKVGPQRWWLIG